MGVSQVLTGVPDPATSTESVAQPGEMAVVASFLEARSTLDKHVATATTRTAGSGSAASPALDPSEEDGEGEIPSRRANTREKAADKKCAALAAAAAPGDSRGDDPAGAR